MAGSINYLSQGSPFGAPILGRSAASRQADPCSEQAGGRGLSFRCVREQCDTSTATGRLLLNFLALLAEFKLEMIRERVVSGMDRARRQGKEMGRPGVMERRGFKSRFARILPAVLDGHMSIGEAASELGISMSFLRYHGRERAEYVSPGY